MSKLKVVDGFKDRRQGFENVFYLFIDAHLIKFQTLHDPTFDLGQICRHIEST